MGIVSVTSWHIILQCGEVLHGSDVGSFVNVKTRTDIKDLYVESGAGKIYAVKRKEGRPPLSFDFFIHIIKEDDGRQEAYWKLITNYPDCTFIKHVQRNGKCRIETKNGDKRS